MPQLVGATSPVRNRRLLGLGKAALVIAHPGHELCIYQSCRLLAPVFYVITDGSGKSSPPRIGSTTCLRQAIGAAPGSVYGRIPDTGLYDRMLMRDVGFFADMAREIAVGLVRDGIECVLGDSLEFADTAHDVCRLIINAAVRVASQRSGRSVLNLDFPIYTMAESPPDGSAATTRCLTLSDDELREKLHTARNYREIASEPLVQLAIRQPELVRIERLRSVSAQGVRRPPDRPGYELAGERGVAQGYFTDVIRFETHVLPIARALEALA